MQNIINLIKEVNQWGELKCPRCGFWITKRNPEMDYRETVIMCFACNTPLTLGTEICQQSNKILAALRVKIRSQYEGH